METFKACTHRKQSVATVSDLVVVVAVCDIARHIGHGLFMSDLVWLCSY